MIIMHPRIALSRQRHVPLASAITPLITLSKKGLEARPKQLFLFVIFDIVLFSQPTITLIDKLRPKRD